MRNIPPDQAELTLARIFPLNDQHTSGEKTGLHFSPGGEAKCVWVTRHESRSAIVAFGY